MQHCSLKNLKAEKYWKTMLKMEFGYVIRKLN